MPLAGFADSFTTGASADWDSSTTTNTNTSGRHGNGLDVNGSSNLSTIVGNDSTTIECGVAYRTLSFQNPIITIHNNSLLHDDFAAYTAVAPGGLYGGRLQFRLMNCGDGRVNFHYLLADYTGISNQIFSISGLPSTFAMHTNRWYHIKVAITINSYTYTLDNNGTPGDLSDDTVDDLTYDITANCYINDQQVCGDSFDTDLFDNAKPWFIPSTKLTFVKLLGPGGGNYATFDDFYIYANELPTGTRGDCEATGATTVATNATAPRLTSYGVEVLVGQQLNKVRVDAG